MFNEAMGLWISPTTGKTYTPAQYENLSAIGKRAAAASKALAAVVASEDYQRDVAEMEERQKANTEPMRRLPGTSWRDHAHYVAVDRAMRNFKR